MAFALAAMRNEHLGEEGAGVRGGRVRTVVPQLDVHVNRRGAALGGRGVLRARHGPHQHVFGLEFSIYIQYDRLYNYN